MRPVEGGFSEVERRVCRGFTTSPQRCPPKTHEAGARKP
jgi:hypothetical protein